MIDFIGLVPRKYRAITVDYAFYGDNKPKTKADTLLNPVSKVNYFLNDIEKDGSYVVFSSSKSLKDVPLQEKIRMFIRFSESNPDLPYQKPLLIGWTAITIFIGPPLFLQRGNWRVRTFAYFFHKYAYFSCLSI